MNPFIETKSNGSIKDVDSQSRVVSGYLSSFGNVDYDQDIIEKGAFSKSIAERFDKMFFLFNHDWSKPLAKFNKLEEDEKGLYFEAEISKTSYGNDLIQLYTDGLVAEHSIGFSTVKSEAKQDIRVIKEVKLYEGSAVVLGANSATPFLGFKSALKEINEKQTKIIKALRNGTLTDDTFTMLEFSLKQLQAEAYELGKNTQKEVEPSQITQKDSYEPLINIINNFKF